MRAFRLAVACLAVLVLGGFAHAAELAATPATLRATFAAAGEGDVITLAAGDYGVAQLTGRKFARPITIKAQAGTFARVLITNVEGVDWVGGKLDPRGSTHWAPTFYVANAARVRVSAIAIQDGWTNDGVSFRNSTDVALSDASIDKAKVGVSCLDSTGFLIHGVGISSKGWDGVDVAACYKGTVEYVACVGTNLIGDMHPDCVQIWSIAGKPATSDIVIQYNFALGNTQGFTGFSRNGVGFDRITMRENRAYVSNSGGNALTLINARDSLVRDNQVRTIDGSWDAARVQVIGGSNNVVCGNVSLFNASKPPVVEKAC